MDKIVQVPWTTGFETGFCDYQRSGGICYSAPDASYEIVDNRLLNTLITAVVRSNGGMRVENFGGSGLTGGLIDAMLA